MKVYISSLEDSSLDAQRALLVYKSCYGDTLCTLNNIENGNILPGTPVNAANLAEFFDFAGSGTAKRESGIGLRWVDERILASAGGRVLWWVPGQVRDIFFNTKISGFDKLSGKPFPFPPMIFYADRQNLFVFALKKTVRPAKDIKLFAPPFWNCGRNGRVCLPVAVRTRRGLSISEWEKIFFHSAFSHPGPQGDLTVSGTQKLFSRLIREKAVKFPSSELVSTPVTMEEILGGKLK